ncbi:hypothetical protein PINS_up012455 [Pythium insidiosum]|nr:hypothetical protein PINS_up012455 [Pythium insidiosum]
MMKSSSTAAAPAHVKRPRDSLYTIEEDVLLLRESLRLKPFMETARIAAGIWCDIAKNLNACEDFLSKYPSVTAGGRLTLSRFKQLLQLRRQQLERKVASQRRKSKLHAERETLLDTCLSLMEQRPVHPSAQHYTVHDHVLILREVVVNPPQIHQRHVGRSLWDDIVKKMREHPEFSKPTVNVQSAQRVVRDLIDMRRKQWHRNESLSHVDADHREREKLLDQCIDTIEGQIQVKMLEIAKATPGSTSVEDHCHTSEQPETTTEEPRPKASRKRSPSLTTTTTTTEPVIGERHDIVADETLESTRDSCDFIELDVPDDSDASTAETNETTRYHYPPQQTPSIKSLVRTNGKSESICEP